jgi:elongator complex protein 6
MSARELATGAAKDISGVLRVTRGGDAHELDTESSVEVREAELQYLVQRDGIVRVFSRGADVN